MSDDVFKAYDIRAIYPEPLSESLAWQIGHGTARFLLEQDVEETCAPTIVVGRDMRTSSPDLAAALTAGIRARGAGVIDVGMVDTPFCYYAINTLGCIGGVQVTASHNPAEYNGFKISRQEARPVGRDTGLRDIQAYAEKASREGAGEPTGSMEERDLWAGYREHVLQFLSPRLQDGRSSLTVAVDASNGMAGTMVPRVFGDVQGLEIIHCNFDNTSGHFAHEPNPLVEANLAEVRDMVVARGCDLGICFDGDADRCVVVDEQGAIVGCDLLTAWLAQGFLEREPGATITYDLRSSHSLPDLVKAAGGRAVRSRVGHVFMKQLLADCGAVFGGELSGHFYFRDNFHADSGAIAFAVIVSRLVEEGGSLSARIAPTRCYAQSGEINFENDDKEGAIEALLQAWPDAETDRLDGLTLDCGDWWCNVRLSNTEPLLRLNLEAESASEIDRLVSEVSAFLGHRVDH